MRNKIIEALKGSIIKWEGIVEGTGVDSGSENCPLCLLFTHRSCTLETYNLKDYGSTTWECPVLRETGHTNCSESPYSEWHEHQDIEHCHNEEKRIVQGCPICKELAEKELEFLTKLLSKYESEAAV